MKGYDHPGRHPTVRAEYEAYSEAIQECTAYNIATGKTLHAWERAEALAEGETFLKRDPAYEIELERRAYEADKAYYEAYQAIGRQEHPELYRDGVGPWFRHPDEWEELYPNVAAEPTPCEAGITADPDANWGDFYIDEHGTVTRFFIEDPDLEKVFAAPSAPEPEIDADDPEIGSLPPARNRPPSKPRPTLRVGPRQDPNAVIARAPGRVRIRKGSRLTLL